MRVLGVAVAAAGLHLGAFTGLEPPPLLRHEPPALLSLANASSASCCHAAGHLQEVLSLSELPLERLLRVQLAMQPLEEAHTDSDGVDRQGEPLPRAEALRSRHRPRRPPPAAQRGDLIETGGGSLGTKQSKLATGFQLAITVLSFLAFGAYLISLVVSIVRNNNTSGTATTQTPFVLVPATAGRRKRRADPPWLPPRLPQPEHVFNAITAAAQAYARFEGHEIDL